MNSIESRALSCFMSFFISITQCLACEVATFYPEEDVRVELLSRKASVEYFVYSKLKEISKEIAFDTEKSLQVKIDDYNFDGHKDIAVSHIDDGMGVFMVYRVFLYSTQMQDFEEVTPGCGDQFLNLQVDKARGILISTYYENNIPALCVTRLEK